MYYFLYDANILHSKFTQTLINVRYGHLEISLSSPNNASNIGFHNFLMQK